MGTHSESFITNYESSESIERKIVWQKCKYIWELYEMRQKCDYIIQNTKMNPKRTQDPDEEKWTMYYLIKYANEYKNAMLFFCVPEQKFQIMQKCLHQNIPWELGPSATGETVETATVPYFGFFFVQGAGNFVYVCGYVNFEFWYIARLLIFFFNILCVIYTSQYLRVGAIYCSSATEHTKIFCCCFTIEWI